MTNNELATKALNEALAYYDIDTLLKDKRIDSAALEGALSLSNIFYTYLMGMPLTFKDPSSERVIQLPIFSPPATPVKE